ncbi:MAG TPA: divalent-cation tolerance protein CutA [Acidobacteriaceae bacterium]|jgi:periplasmic divalent cation tolerance protein|nr:divalent-cation tolerance protein CutA [Acidobacteriaceae bacterium]
MDLRLILTTCATRDEAERIARSLVEDRLAACVNLIPGLTSIYRWQGAIDTASETLLLIKTTAGQADQVEAAVRRLHSFELPEFLVLPVEAASPLYAAWIMSSLKGATDSSDP